MTELLGCPFCGGPAEIIEADEAGDCAYAVQCQTRGCEASSRVYFALKDDVTEQLAAAWNRRAKPECEPVAWRYRTQRSDGQWSAWVVTSEDPSKDGWAGGYEAIPLYTSPVAWPDREAVARAAWAHLWNATFVVQSRGATVSTQQFDETSDQIKATYRALADAILALPQAERPGFKLVPVEPTEAMLKAWFAEEYEQHVQPEPDPAKCYAAMLAAAPALSGEV